MFRRGRKEVPGGEGWPCLLYTSYDWTVTLWGDGGDWASASSWFETAKQEEPWQAQWIAADFQDKEVQPLLAVSYTHLDVYKRQEMKSTLS